jgi:hypothetical protein
MGPPKRVDKQRSRGKLTARERIEGLMDPNSYFLEFSAFAGYKVYEDNLPAAENSRKYEFGSIRPSIRSRAVNFPRERCLSTLLGGPIFIISVNLEPRSKAKDVWYSKFDLYLSDLGLMLVLIIDIIYDCVMD